MELRDLHYRVRRKSARLVVVGDVVDGGLVDREERVAVALDRDIVVDLAQASRRRRRRRFVVVAGEVVDGREVVPSVVLLGGGKRPDPYDPHHLMISPRFAVSRPHITRVSCFTRRGETDRSLCPSTPPFRMRK